MRRRRTRRSSPSLRDDDDNCCRALAIIRGALECNSLASSLALEHFFARAQPSNILCLLNTVEKMLRVLDCNVRTVHQTYSDQKPRANGTAIFSIKVALSSMTCNTTQLHATCCRTSLAEIGQKHNLQTTTTNTKKRNTSSTRGAGAGPGRAAEAWRRRTAASLAAVFRESTPAGQRRCRADSCRLHA